MTQYEPAYRPLWQAETAKDARVLRQYIDRIFDEYFHVRTAEHTGRVTGVGGGRVAVTLLGGDGTPGRAVQAWPGQPNFPTSAVGKLVRVWERITSQVNPEGGFVITDQAYIVDTLLGGQ